MLSFNFSQKEKQIYKSGKGLIGLDNICNTTCYLNTVIQCLSKTIVFSNIFLSKENPPIWERHINMNKKEKEFVIAFKNLINGMWLNEKGVIRPLTLLDLIQRNFESFSGYEQQDVHEIFIYLVDALHTGFSKEVNIDITGNPKNKLEKLELMSMKSFKQQYNNDYSIILDLFYGQLITEIITTDGKHESYSFSPFSTLEVPIKDTSNSSVSLEECLDKFGEKELMTDDSKWYNDDTKQYHDARKSTTIFKLPNVMVLLLKRFNHNRRKNRKLITFPKVIDFKKHIFCPELIENNTDSIYSLYAVCNHIGELNGGHYYANCKLNNNWYRYDDSNVQQIQFSNVVSSDAYMLFYIKKSLEI